MIIYFSGTGNSEYVARRLAALTGDRALDLFGRIKSNTTDALNSDRPWVVVTPAYAWKLPGIVEDHLKKTSLTGSSDIYYVLTCGDSVAGAGIYARDLSNAIGKTYKGLAPVIMPENYIAMFPVPDRDESLKIIEDAEDTIRNLADCISANRDFDAKPGSRFMSSLINWVFFKFFVKDRKFTVDERCNSCGLCEKECPLNNVKLSAGKPVWNGSCTHCMRCICKCPQEAIEYGKASLGKWRYLCPAEAAGETVPAQKDGAAAQNSGDAAGNSGAAAEKTAIAFAKASPEDISPISDIYDHIHTQEESGEASIGWSREIYPTKKTAEEAVAAGDMFVAKINGEVVAAARINKEQVHPAYDEVNWKYEAAPEDVLVIHTLVVDPETEHRGVGKAFVNFYEELAESEGCKTLRLDTNEKNSRARSMYKKLGYEEAAILPCTFNGISGVNLVCIEKKVER